VILIEVSIDINQVLKSCCKILPPEHLEHFFSKVLNLEDCKSQWKSKKRDRIMNAKANEKIGKHDSPPSVPNWHNISLFLGLTFALSWGLNLLMWLAKDNLDQTATLLLQVQMLLPAFCAILLNLFVFKDSPLHSTKYVTTLQPNLKQAEGGLTGGRKVFGPRWFFYTYLLFTLVYAVLALFALIRPKQTMVISALSGGLNMLMVALLLAIRILSGKQSFLRAGLQGGKPLHWLLFGLAFLFFYGLSATLNAAFKLAQPSDPAALLAAMSGGQSVDMALPALRLLLFVQMVIFGPLLGLLMGFGEEYGWRSYLQKELIKLGKVKGVLLLGIIWGIWHFPIVWMGINYPNYPVWGSLTMAGYTILLGFVLSYAMLKTGSIWLVAFIHTINNQSVAFFTIAFYQVNNPVLSFGSGLYGLLIMLPIVALLLRDRVWHSRAGSDLKQS
jgi:membrane protease YdiL (CAAX protease family)